MKEITLSNGMRIPTLGYGVFGITDPAQCERAVIDAVEAGYRLIDTAPGYENEEAVGRAVRHYGLPREEVLVSTKLEASQMGSYDKAMRAFDRSLETMGLDYMDIYLFHWPMGDVYGTWRALEENYKAGRVKAIGVCNFWPYRLADFLLDQQTVPLINQIELHPFYQRKAEIAWNRSRNIQVQAWSPFAEGKNDIFNNPVLKAIGQKYGKSVAQVILRWLLQQGLCVLSKTVSRERMRENRQVFDFELTEEDMQEIGTLDGGKTLILDQHDPDNVEYLSKLGR
ncbi:aldo/keto reductase [Bacteroides sp.]|uniref:aldo/keto reductase n=1 Tax=Bacteroides sp. TaxID=29523 RepID=UPI003AABDEFB